MAYTKRDRKFKVTLVEDGEDKTEMPMAASWTAFLNGEWLAQKPTRSGKYMVGNRQGRVIGEAFAFYKDKELVVQVRDSAFCRLKDIPDEYWWWSVRMPQILPQAIPNRMTFQEALEDYKLRQKVEARQHLSVVQVEA